MPEAPAFPYSPAESGGNIRTVPPRREGAVRLLCLGDVIGRPGRNALKERLAGIVKRFGIDFVVANGENAAGGIGLTPEAFKELRGAGVHVVTSGNHIWKHREIYQTLERDVPLLRPANYGAEAPGRGLCVVPFPESAGIAVLNLQGRTFMEPIDCPFKAADALLAELDAMEQPPLIRIVDFHAEATSEKRALVHYLDGRVSAVFGTHTHVQTADTLISEAGTASLTDLGMCGDEKNSVIGMKAAAVTARFVTGLPHPFKPAGEQVSLNGAIVDIDKIAGRALSLRLLRDNPAEPAAF